MIEKVSIVTVSKNSEKTIRKTILSVLSQSVSCYEYIFIDGNSSDRTCQIIEEYKEVIVSRGILYKFVSEQDTGTYNAMNKAIKVVTGDWICFLNSDDYFFSEKVIEKIFSNNCNLSNYGLIYGNTMCIRDNISFLKRASSMMDLTYKNPFIHQSSFVKSAIAKKYGFNEKYKFAADFDQFLRMYRDNVPFLKTDQIIACYSYGGSSQKNTLLTLREFEKIRRKNGFGFKKLLKRYIYYLGVLIIKNNKVLYGMYEKIMANS